MAKIKDISREAGVSMAVVSVVLNGVTTGRIKASPATAQRIREIAKRLDYRPNLIARQLTGKKSGVIGVVMDSCAPQSYHERLSKIEAYASSKGYRLMIGQAHNDIARIKDYAQFFTDYCVDGVICMAHGYPMPDGVGSDGIAEFFLARRKTVFFQPPAGIPDSCSVTIDLAYNFREAVKYLAAKGRRRIGFLKLSDFYAGPSMSIAQLGYQEGLAEAGLPFEPGLVKSIELEDVKHADKAMGQTCGLLEAGADAIIASNDFSAAGVLKCLHRKGVSIPGQVAVIGCDNLDVADLVSPGLTTFEQGNDTVAVKLVDLLLELIEGHQAPPEGRHIVVQPTMITRESA